MTLFDTILKKVQSMESVRKYTSPPPEIDDRLLQKKRFKRNKKVHRTPARVDSSPPKYHNLHMYKSLLDWKRHVDNMYMENARILFAITSAYMRGGKVDSHWSSEKLLSKQYYMNRVQKYQSINYENKRIYQRIKTTRPRVVTNKELQRSWSFNKHEIIQTSRKPFILFPTRHVDKMEDPAFFAPKGVHRPRAYITLKMKNAAVIGTLTVELFVDACPATCRLFLELLDGDGLGHGYVGTQFFRKVPHLYWSGGDVIHNNGFGCYAQRGRLTPIPAENYHFSHSMPGLLSMQVSPDGYTCGLFNITFKPLPQFDLKNVVFGRVVRPSPTYEVIRTLGNPLGTYPVIEISESKRKDGSQYIRGIPNKIKFS